MHYTLTGEGVASQSVEQHWRLDWSERGSSGELLRTAAPAPAPDGLRRADPAQD